MSGANFESEVWVQPWSDRHTEAGGVQPDHPYVERYWTSVIGPTQLLLLRHVAEELEASPDGFAMDMADTARQLGVSPNKGGLGVQRAFDRLEIYRLASRGHALWAVRRALPVLSPAQLSRLPDRLRRSHKRDAAEATAVWDEKVAGAAARIALDMAESGEGEEAIRRRLRTLRVPTWARDDAARLAVEEAHRTGRQGPADAYDTRDGGRLLAATGT